MACICKHHHGQRAQSFDGSSPRHVADLVSGSQGIRGKVVNDEYDQISDSHQGHNTSVLQRVQAPQEGQRHDDEHEDGDPEVPVHQIRDLGRSTVESFHHAGHQVANDDQIRDGHAKALDGYSSLEKYGRVRIGHLGNGAKRGSPSVEVSGASGLEVETEGGGEGGPDDDDHSQRHTEM